MQTKVNISKKKVVRFAVGTALVCLFITLLFTTSYSYKNSFLKDVQINLPKDQVMLMSKEAYKELLKNESQISIDEIRIKDLNLESIEGVLESNAWIREVEAYVDNSKILQLEIYQNVPVARIFTQTGSSFYLDKEHNILPVNTTLPLSIPIFTNVPVLNNDEHSNAIKSSIVHLADVIVIDSFYNAQITQIAMTSNGEFELSSIMGNHIIKFGDTSRTREKLSNLFLFYKHGLNKLGWDRYDVVDIRYKGQVVTSPAMGYIAPIVADTTVELPDPEEGQSPVSHEPKVVVANLPLPNINRIASIQEDDKLVDSNIAKAAPTIPKKLEEKPKESKTENKKTAVKKEAAKPAPKKDTKAVAKKPVEQKPKTTTAKTPEKKTQNKQNIQQKPKHLLPAKN